MLKVLIITFHKLKIKMSNDNKEINNNNYLIGSKPETIKADIMNFKEEVLVDFKELSKRLEQKYNKINKELKDNMELFNTKISNFNLKLLELSSKIVTDTNTKQKLSELIIFKEKAENSINSNKVQLKLYSDESIGKINEIDELLKESFIFPGLIGPKCKHKNFREFIEFIYTQINSLNNYKEKSLIDFGLYKTRIEYLFNSLKIKFDNSQKEITYNCNDKIEKCEENLFREMSLRDEKFKNIRMENQEYIMKLDRNLSNLNEQMNKVKKKEDDIDIKLENIENQNSENFIKIKARNNNIENKIFNLQNNFLNTLNYLNQQGANLKIIKENEKISHENKIGNLFDNEAKEDNFEKNNSFNKMNDENNNNQLTKNKETETSIKSNIHTNKNRYNTKDNIEEYNEKGKFKKRLKSSGGRESDITKYVKGEITADEIGLSTNSRRKILRALRNEFEEHLIDKQEHQKSYLFNKEIKENKEENKIIYNQKNLNDELVNDDLYFNYTNSFENKKGLKTERRMAKHLSGYKNIMKIDFKDLDARFQSDELSVNFGFKTSRNNNKTLFNKFKKEKSYINHKNSISAMNFTKINKPNNKIMKNKFMVKNLSIIPNSKILSLNNMHKELSFINAFSNDNNDLNVNKLLSQLNKKNEKNLENNKSLYKLENNALPPPKLSIPKVSKKIFNFNLENSNNNKGEYNFNSNLNSDFTEYTK